MHVPVLLGAVLKHLPASCMSSSPSVIVDCTFGNGGYTKKLLECTNSLIIALDKDSCAFNQAKLLQQQHPKRVLAIHGTFSNISNLLYAHGYEKQSIDGIILDIGVSSTQIDQPHRGFSFKNNGPLDMRMDTCSPTTAEEIVNTMSESDLSRLIKLYGEESQHKKIARAIIQSRLTKPIQTTTELSDIVINAVCKNGHWPFGVKHPAMKTFQAIRIHVNNELEELKMVLNSAEYLLKPFGHLAAVTFHSLEDRIVKKFMLKSELGVDSLDDGWDRSRRKQLRDSKGNTEIAVNMNSRMPHLSTFTRITKKPIIPSMEEINDNPRARSAKLRVAQRTENQK